MSLNQFASAGFTSADMPDYCQEVEHLTLTLSADQLIELHPELGPIIAEVMVQGVAMHLSAQAFFVSTAIGVRATPAAPADGFRYCRGRASDLRAVLAPPALAASQP